MLRRDWMRSFESKLHTSTLPLAHDHKACSLTKSIIVPQTFALFPWLFLFIILVLH